MALRILYGAPHSGMSEKICEDLIREAVAHPDRAFVMLVPEQASLTVQEELVRRHPSHALSNIDVLTFRRLAYRVFKETGYATRNILDDEGKMLFLQLAVNRKRGELKDLRRSTTRIGMLDELKSVFSEFAEYNVTPETLREKTALLTEHRKLKQKLEDITILYEEFLTLAHERFDLMEEQMGVLAEAVRTWKSAPLLTVALDGFTGFTPPQYEVLEALMGHCRDVTLGLTVGTAYVHEEHRHPEDLFYMPDHAAEKTKELAIQLGIPVTEERLPSGNDPRPAALKFLEANLFGQTRDQLPGETDAVRIVRAHTAREEITFVLREIMKNIREGYRYRDLAIVTGDPEAYREELEECLRDAGLPYFFDANKSLDHSPLIRLITDALWIFRSGFGFDAVVSFLKNPLVVESGGEKTAYARIAEVENFAMARGFRSRSGYGKEWQGGYRNFDPARLPAVNETKDTALAPMFAFYDRMSRGKPTVEDRIAALKTLLSAYSVEAGLQKIGETYEQVSHEPVKKEYEAVAAYVSEFLDRAADILSDMELSTDEFEDMILSVLRHVELGHVPPTKDRLLIGNLTRTRLGNVKKLFVLGANDGKLPVPPNGDGLLNDRDRIALKEVNVSLAETAEENAFNNRYYLYLLLNEPSEALILTYAAAENNGEGLLPASIVASLLGAFPDVKVETAEAGAFAGVYSARSGLTELAESLRELRLAEKEEKGPEPDEATRALYQWFRGSAAYEEAIREIGEGLFYRYQKELLPPELAEELYGEVIRGSVSRLEGFAACPYRHFLQYGLQISPRTVFSLAASDLGTIAHNSIETFFRLLSEEEKDWTEISAEEQADLISRSVDEVTAGYGNDILSDSARNTYLVTRIRRIMTRTLWALARQWKAGAFTSTESEFSFKEQGLSFFSLTPEEGTRLALAGRIDRIDLADDGEKVYVKVIDYKSGYHTLDYTQIYHGLQLQLLLYMQVALAREKRKAPAKEVIPAGIYYYTVQDPFVEETDEARVEDSIFGKLRMNGLTNSACGAAGRVDSLASAGESSTVVSGLKRTDEETFEGDSAVSGEELKGLGAFSVRKAAELSKEIAAGKIEASPYQDGGASACDYCDYRGICGQDRRIRSYERRPLEKKELNDLLGGTGK